VKLAMTTRQAERVLRVAAVCAIVALALIVWGALDPRPIALVVAMSVGQGLGTLSLIAYLLIVVADLRRSRLFDDRPQRFSQRPPDDR
jgi:hypothetical protein